MKSACLAIATLTLLFGQKAIGQIEGDPKEGANTSLADTERDISNLLKGALDSTRKMKLCLPKSSLMVHP